MKKYTHAWLAFMAMKRLEMAAIPESEGKQTNLNKHAQKLVKWFKNYRDSVVRGAWYPDEVFCDQGTSHGVKYEPQTDYGDAVQSFKTLPQTMEVYQLMKKESSLYQKPFNIVKGNLCDRCDAMAHTIVDNFKIQYKEEKGNPLVPTNTHMAMRFYIFSHYIADGHMPFHCDARSLDTLHAEMEKDWENQVKKSYKIDTDNNRFYYDPDGYPLQTGNMTSLVKTVEEKLMSRPFTYSWGNSDYSTWDYMSAVSEYSYLLAYSMVPTTQEDPGNMKWTAYKKTEAYARYEEYSSALFADAIDSIARAWLHVWIRYREWGPDKVTSGKSVGVTDDYSPE